jgi:SAM-dependent methyltransferase
MSGWRDFWNGEHSIYVSDRHRLLHYDRVAKDQRGLITTPDAQVLDHGCGEALAAGDVARGCATLYLYDAAPSVQERLRGRFGADRRIVVLSNTALEIIAPRSLDLIIVNSVLQYLPVAEFEALLHFWHGKLKRGGRLALADVIPPDASALADIKSLLSFSLKGGFFFAALAGLAKTYFSAYRKLRSGVGLTRYTQEDMFTLLRAHDFEPARAPANIGPNAARLLFFATPK